MPVKWIERPQSEHNETLQLRLLESVRIGENIIPRNALLTAKSKLSGNRMMLYVTTIELGENIYPVKLTAYDMDGLEGVFIPDLTKWMH